VARTLELLARHYLKDVARDDVLLSPLDDLFILRGAEVGETLRDCSYLDRRALKGAVAISRSSRGHWEGGRLEQGRDQVVEVALGPTGRPRSVCPARRARAPPPWWRGAGGRR